MDNKVFWGVIIFICLLPSAYFFTHSRQISEEKTKLKKPDRITTFVMGDILYLEDNKVWNYNGNINLVFNSRREAILYQEQVTLAIMQQTVYHFDSLSYVLDSIKQAHL